MRCTRPRSNPSVRCKARKPYEFGVEVSLAVTHKLGLMVGLIAKGQTATLQFDAAGHIAYICGLHPGMKGTIEVAAK